jgi:hypothetical protein
MINEKQKRIIEFIRNRIDAWENTNDISSPTHICEIEALEIGLTDVLREIELLELDDIIQEMYFFIRGCCQ